MDCVSSCNAQFTGNSNYKWKYIPKHNHKYTILTMDWQQITQANTFLYKKHDSIETMHVLVSASLNCLQHTIPTQAQHVYNNY